MSFKFNFKWNSVGNGPLHIKNTMGDFILKADQNILTKNEDIWSKTVKNTVLTSAFPLCMWLAQSWWRLMFEPLPPNNIKPSIDWRLSHEMASANNGFLWPAVSMASDTEFMQIWSKSSDNTKKQSIYYLTTTMSPVLIEINEFEKIVDDFFNTVLSRLDATKIQKTSLHELWNEVNEERNDKSSFKYRKFEAELGYDPDECPYQLMEKVLNIEKKIDHEALSELIPICGKNSFKEPLNELDELIQSTGIKGKFDFSFEKPNTIFSNTHPWQKANIYAQKFRKLLDLKDTSPVSTKKLYEIIGLTKSQIDSWLPVKRQNVSIGIPETHKIYKFYPRKKYPTSKRFELARFLGDYLNKKSDKNVNCIASSDLSTQRQRFQRAFAAEFLCPFQSLEDFLKNDFSDSAIEEAAEYFEVSETTVKSILANHGYLSFLNNL
jgi:hypothetical protein